MAVNRSKPSIALLTVIALVCGTGASTAQSSNGVTPPPSETIPLPDPLGSSGFDPDNPLNTSPPANEDENKTPSQAQAGDEEEEEEEEVEILYDTSVLPKPVARMRELIMEAARSGDPEALRPLLGTGPSITQLSFGDVEGDPVEYIQSVSGDSEGHEMLAILLEVMEAGYVHLEKGTDNEIYVWPYFYAIALEDLTAVQRVELFKLVTAGDYEDMVSFGAYIFFRVGITPQGRWVFFVAGD